MPDSPDRRTSQSHPNRRNTPRDGSGDPETIVAISSPPGRGGIGVVRLSGPRAAAISARLFRAATPVTRDDGAVVFGRFVNTAGESIDHGYRIVFRPPATFTGEETAELWAHPARGLLRQRRHGEFLWQSEKRTRQSTEILDPSRCGHRHRELHRGILQPETTALTHQRHQSRGV